MAFRTKHYQIRFQPREPPNRYQLASTLCITCYDRAPINARPKLKGASLGTCSLCHWRGSVFAIEQGAAVVVEHKR